MNPPKMPIHIGDYRRDTGHLRAAQHGAYFLLLMHYWSTGALPDDDAQLAAIACMSRGEWQRARPILEKFFKSGWRHGRVEKDLDAARASYAKRAKAGEKGGKAKAESKQSSSNATAKPEQCSSYLIPLTLDQSKKDSEAIASAAGAAADFDEIPGFLKREPAINVVDEDPKARLFRIGKTILISFGIAESRTGSLIGQWLKKKPDPLGILAALEFARDQNVAEPVAYVSAIIYGRAKNGAGPRTKPTIDELIADAEKREGKADPGRTIDA